MGRGSRFDVPRTVLTRSYHHRSNHPSILRGPRCRLSVVLVICRLDTPTGRNPRSGSETVVIDALEPVQCIGKTRSHRSREPYYRVWRDLVPLLLFNAYSRDSRTSRVSPVAHSLTVENGRGQRTDGWCPLSYTGKTESVSKTHWNLLGVGTSPGTKGIDRVPPI